MNNIDDLLKDMDEVLNIDSSPQKRKSNNTHFNPPSDQNHKSNSQSPMKKKNDLDSLLDEMNGLEEIKYDKAKTPKLDHHSISVKKGKCFQILVSNEDKICLKTDAFQGQTICDKLRCTCCDRKVNIYKGFSFAKECDYLFFRNYSMDADKISQKLIKDENFTSYHCQCKWLSTKKTMNISNDSNYTWVCGGH